MNKNLETIHHIAIPVTDIVAAVAFYTARFRVAVDYQDDSWALLRFANTKLALVTPDQHPPHIAVERADLEADADARPIATHRDGTRSLYIEDPWSNVIELLDTDGATDPS
ncbi:MAG: VOC family protein [Alphaproteobacteria bacterium]|nr:VOC family protein [Alphaproteobacteria bacterium]